MNTAKQNRSDELRERAEQLINGLEGNDRDGAGHSIREVLHELHVHQIELELQNEELQSAQKALETSRQSYMRLYNRAPVGYVVMDRAGIVKMANETFATMVGSESIEVNGRPFTSFLVHPDQPIFLARLKGFFKKPENKHIDVRLAGHRRPLHVNLQAVFTDEGRESSAHDSGDELLVAVTDISEQKLQEAEILEQHRQLDAILASISDGFISLDRHLVIRYFNRAAEQMLDRDYQTVIGRQLVEVFPELGGSDFEKNAGNALEHEGAVFFESYLESHREWLEVSIYPFADGLTIFFRNITEKKRAEQLLRESEERFRSFIQSSPLGVLVLDERARIRQVNPASCRLTGYSESELLAKASFELAGPEFQEAARNRFEQLKSGSFNGEIRLRLKDGALRWFSLAAVKLSETSYLGFIEDISERIEMQQRLARSKQALELSHKIATIFLTVEEDDLFSEVLAQLLRTFSSQLGYFGYLNDDGDLVCPTFSREIWKDCQVENKSVVFPQARWSGLWGRSLKERRALLANDGLRVPTGHLQLENAMAVPILHRERLIGQFVLANKKGGYAEAELDLLQRAAEQTAPILTAFLERLKQKALTEELEETSRQLAKTESLSRMAGAIAHNYNNALTVVLGNLEIALEDCRGLAPGLTETLSRAHQAACQMNNLGMMMLTYLGQPPTGRGPDSVLELNGFLRGYLNGRKGRQPEAVRLELELPEAALKSRLNQDLLSRTLDNLLANSIEAIGDQGGTVTITARLFANDTDSDEDLRYPPDWQPLERRYCCLRVTDTGSGIEPEGLKNIFDPFYTTRFTGRGMGLPLVAGIVRGYQGAIKVWSTPGTGTAVCLILPLC